MKPFQDILSVWTSFESALAFAPTLRRSGSDALQHLSTLCGGSMHTTDDGTPCWPEELKCLTLMGQPEYNGPKGSMDMVLNDMRIAGNGIIFDFIHLERASQEVSEQQLISGAFRLIAGDAVSRLYGVLAVSSTPHGLDVADLRPAPFDHFDDCVVHPSPWLTTYLPPGAILHPKMEYAGSSTYFNHLSGTALFICWPPTTANLDIFSTVHEQACSHKRLHRCLINMQDVEFIHLSEPTSFHLGPAAIYAVIATKATIFTTKRFWRWLQMSVATTGMWWSWKWLKDCDDDVTPEAVEAQHASLKVDIDMWPALAERHPQDPDWLEFGGDMLAACRDGLTKLEDARQRMRLEFHLE